MINDVKVIIKMIQAIVMAGFGYPLILASKASAAKPYTECGGLSEVFDAGYAENTDVYRAASLIFMQDNAPSKIAVCSVTDTAVIGLGKIIDYGWRQLILLLGASGDSTVKQVSDYIEGAESNGTERVGKMLYLTLEDLTALSGVTGKSRTVGFVYPKNATYPETAVAVAALVGATAGKQPGSITYKNTILKGLEPLVKTDTELTALHASGGFTLVRKAGDVVTTEGITTEGEYIDIVDSKDYIISQLEYHTQKLLNSTGKIPYTDAGISQLESVAVNVLRSAYNNGMIAENDDGSPAYTVNYAVRSESDPADRAARKYMGGKFSFELAGAVHTVEISGEIII